MTEEEANKLLDNLAWKVNQIGEELSSVLRALPNSRSKSLAITNFDTGMLWMQEAFKETNGAILVKEIERSERRTKKGKHSEQDSGQD